MDKNKALAALAAVQALLDQEKQAKANYKGLQASNWLTYGRNANMSTRTMMQRHALKR